jgi:hypothetical protein
VTQVLAPGLRPLCEIRAELGAPIEKGGGPGGRWRIIPIIGGTVEGERLSEGYAELDTRYLIETHDGVMIDIRNFGLRHGPPEVLAQLSAGEPVDPALYYMRTSPRFQTGDPRYNWLNRTMFIGTGERMPSAVRINIFEVL